MQTVTNAFLARLSATLISALSPLRNATLARWIHIGL